METIHALKDYANISDSLDMPLILMQKLPKGSEVTKPERESKEGTKNGPTIKLMTRDSNNGNNSNNPFQGNPAVVSFLANEVI